MRSAIRITDGDLARAVRGVEQRLKHVAVLAEPLPPRVNVRDLEIEPDTGLRLPTARSELNRPKVEVHVRRSFWRSVPLGHNP